MTPEDFDKLQGLLATRAGYRLTRDRMNLAEHRLGPIARREGYANVEALLANLWAYAMSQGWLGQPPNDDGRMSGRLNQELNADRVTVLPPAR
mgnify:CR=1 FL=1